MTTAQEIYQAIDRFAPFSTAMSWDNSGFLVDTESDQVGRVLMALDITGEVAEEAAALGAQLIVSHHPVIFSPLKRLDRGSPLRALAKQGIGAICAHTNLDLAVGGVNQVLAQRLLLENIGPLEEPDAGGFSLGRVGDLPYPMEDEIALTFIKKNLGSRGLRYVPGGQVIQRIAVGGGACGDLVEQAATRGAQLLMTSDVKHNQMLEARALGIALIDAGHYCTERVILEPLAQYLREQLPQAEFFLSQREEDPAHYF